MIRLSKEGQWYKFFNKYNFYPTNLCSLFWTALLIPLLMICSGLIVSWVAVMVLLGWYHLIALFFDVLWPHGSLGVLMGTFVLIQTCIGFYWLTLFAKETSPMVATGDIISQGYHGFKDKFCPLVVWGDE